MKILLQADQQLDLLLAMIHYLFADEDSKATNEEGVRGEVIDFISNFATSLDLAEFNQALERYNGKDLVADFLKTSIGQDSNNEFSEIAKNVRTIHKKIDWETFWSLKVKPAYTESTKLLDSWLSDTRFQQIGDHCHTVTIMPTLFLPAPPAGQIGVSLRDDKRISVALCFGLPGYEGFKSHGMDARWLYRGITHYITQSIANQLSLSSLIQEIQTLSIEIYDRLNVKNEGYFNQYIQRILQAYLFEDASDNAIVFSYLRGGGYLYAPYLINELRSTSKQELQDQLHSAFRNLKLAWPDVHEQIESFREPIFACFLTHWLNDSVIILPSSWRQKSDVRIFVKSLLRYACLLQRTTYEVRFDDEVDPFFLANRSCWIVSIGDENQFLPSSTSNWVRKYKEEASKFLMEQEEIETFQVTFLTDFEGDQRNWRLVTRADSKESLFELLQFSTSYATNSFATFNGKEISLREYVIT